MQNIGLEVHLGHNGSECTAPISKSINFEVLDLTGQHTVTIFFCGCPGAPPIHVQLLRAGWFPASTERPNTVFTFDVLNTFQLLNLQGKLSAYDFYQSLVHKTDNLNISSHTKSTHLKAQFLTTGPRVSVHYLIRLRTNTSNSCQ